MTFYLYLSAYFIEKNGAKVYAYHPNHAELDRFDGRKRSIASGILFSKVSLVSSVQRLEYGCLKHL